MTTKHDPDRTLRAWLDLMPDQAPDRVLSAVSQAVETTPQVRRPFGTAFRRSTHMNRLSIALAAAAALVVAIVGASILLKPAALTGAPSPTPLPAVSPSPTAAAEGPMPAELQARWMGAHRGFADPGAGTSILFEASRYSMNQSNANPTPEVAGDVHGVGGDELRFPASASYAPCDAAVAGLYRWVLSPSGRVLTITLDNDSCAARAADIAGTWWLMGCRDMNTNCLGELDAGTYEAQYITPLLAPGAEWNPLFGGLTYTVPDGWANHADWPWSFSLSLATDFATTTAGSLDPAAQILVLTDVVPDQTGLCPGPSGTPVPTTAAGVMAWLGGVPGIDVGASTSVTVDGLPAVYADLTFDQAELAACGKDQIVQYLGQSRQSLAIGLGERQRLILVEAGAGEILAIRLEVAEQARFDAFVAAAMPVVQSFQFK